MTTKKQVPREIREKFTEMYQDEMKFGILVALNMYKTLNLKKIAKLLGKAETTVIGHLKKLLGEGLIAIDAETTAKSWGKFYRLSSYAEQIFQENREKAEEREKRLLEQFKKITTEQKAREFFLKEIVSKPDLKENMETAKQTLAFTSNIQNLVLNEFISVINKLFELLEAKGEEYVLQNLVFNPADIELYSVSLKLSKMTQLIRLIDKFNAFYKELVQLKTEFESEMDEENVPEDDRYLFFSNLFLGSLEFKYEIKEDKN